MNMAYFDSNFHDSNYRQKILKMMPKDIQKGYQLYRQHKLQEDFFGDQDY